MGHTEISWNTTLQKLSLHFLMPIPYLHWLSKRSKFRTASVPTVQWQKLRHHNNSKLFASSTTGGSMTFPSAQMAVVTKSSIFASLGLWIVLARRPRCSAWQTGLKTAEIWSGCQLDSWLLLQVIVVMPVRKPLCTVLFRPLTLHKPSTRKTQGVQRSP